MPLINLRYQFLCSEKKQQSGVLFAQAKDAQVQATERGEATTTSRVFDSNELSPIPQLFKDVR